MIGLFFDEVVSKLGLGNLFRKEEEDSYTARAARSWYVLCLPGRDQLQEGTAAGASRYIHLDRA